MMPTEEAAPVEYAPEGERMPEAAPEPEAASEPTPEPEAKAPEAEPEPTPEPAVDIFGDDAPEAIAAYDEQDKDFSIKPEDLEDLDPRAMHVLSNLRRDYTRKTQALAERVRAIDEREKGIVKTQEEVRRAASEVSEGRAKILAMFQDESVTRFAKQPEVPEGGVPDRWSEEGQQWHTQKAIADQFQAFLSSFKTLGETETKNLEQAKAQWQADKRKQEIQTFISENPDFNKYRDEIVQLRKESGNHLSAERAYAIVKALHVDPVQEARRASRNAGAKPSLAGRKASALMPPPGLTGAQRAEWFNSNPEAAAELYRRMNRFGD